MPNNFGLFCCNKIRFFVFRSFGNTFFITEYNLMGGDIIEIQFKNKPKEEIEDVLIKFIARQLDKVIEEKR